MQLMRLFESELERQANIARNRALLEELDLKEAAAAIGISAQHSKGAGASKPKPVQPAKRLKRERAEDMQPRRMSARLRKQTDVEDPNESPSKRRKRLVNIILVMSWIWNSKTALKKIGRGRETPQGRGGRTSRGRGATP